MNNDQTQMTLICPKCGFSFHIDYPPDMSDAELEEIAVCPCGGLMQSTEGKP